MKKEKIDFLKMSSKQFDNYMCKTYMEFFGDRRKPMTQTCMCWGFDIGKGWYETLADLCEMLFYIKRRTGIGVNFVQIKEKYGSGRFYYDIITSKLYKKLTKREAKMWQDMISEIVSRAEERVYYICAECGKDYFDKISTGWIYDKCGDCLIKEGKFTKEQIDDIVKGNKDVDK